MEKILNRRPIFEIVLFGILATIIVSCSPKYQATSIDMGRTKSSPRSFLTVRTVGDLEKAVAEATSGATIIVEEGVYWLRKPLTFKRNQVRLRGACKDRSKVVLRGNGMSGAGSPHIIAIQASDICIADLTLGWVPYHGIQIHGEVGATRPRMHNLHILDCGEQLIKISVGPGPVAEKKYSDEGELVGSRLEYTNHAPSWYTNGIDVLAGKDWVVRENKFFRIRGPEGQASGPAILLWQNSLNSLVERNLIVDCSKGIAFGNPHGPDPKSSRHGEGVYDHQGGVIRYNRIVRRTDGDTGIELNKAGGFVCSNNVVFLERSIVNWAIEYRFPVTFGSIRMNLANRPVLGRDGGRAIVEKNITTAEKHWFINTDLGDMRLTEMGKKAVQELIGRN